MNEDIIYRQAAIASAISGRVRTLPTSEDGEDWIRTSEVRESLLNLPSAQPEPRWIPVTERLPDKGGDYLVSKTFHYGKLTQRFIMVAVYALNLREVDHYTFREDRPGWYDIDSEYGAYEVDNITAWMPLPDPWKGGEE